MKTSDQVLNEWVSDEINFNYKGEKALSTFDRFSFSTFCVNLRCDPVFTGAVIKEEAIRELLKRRWPKTRINKLIHNFYSPGNLIYFEGMAELKERLFEIIDERYPEDHIMQSSLSEAPLF